MPQHILLTIKPQNPQTSKPFSPDKNGKRTQDVIIIIRPTIIK